MGLFSKKSTTKPASDSERAFDPESFGPADERFPGLAGYRGYGLKKNAMPENRFKFVRPDGKTDD